MEIAGLERMKAHLDDADPALRDVLLAYRENNIFKVNDLVSNIERWRNLIAEKQMVYENRLDYASNKAQKKRSTFDKPQRSFYGSKIDAQEGLVYIETEEACPGSASICEQGRQSCSAS